MVRVGAEVIDRHTRERARVACIERVPAAADLFGAPIPPHERLTLVFPDGRWANDRLTADVEAALDAADHH